MTRSRGMMAMPPCLRCGLNDRMIEWEFDTDFGGKVEAWGCQRCGTVHVLTFGERPGGAPEPGRIEGNGNRRP